MACGEFFDGRIQQDLLSRRVERHEDVERRARNAIFFLPAQTTCEAHRGEVLYPPVKKLPTGQQVDRLKHDQPDTPQGACDAFRLCLIFDHALRRHEITLLTLENPNLEAGTDARTPHHLLFASVTFGYHDIGYGTFCVPRAYIIQV
jgi:hypothetical protein